MSSSASQDYVLPKVDPAKVAGFVVTTIQYPGAPKNITITPIPKAPRISTGPSAFTSQLRMQGGFGAGGATGGAGFGDNDIVVTASQQSQPAVQSRGANSAPSAGRPKHCFTLAGGLGRALSDSGGVVQTGGYIMAASGYATGMGAGGGLAVASVGERMQLTGDVLRFLGGDSKAAGRALFGVLGGYSVKAIVPSSLRNKAADVLADQGFGFAADLISGADACK